MNQETKQIPGKSRRWAGSLLAVAVLLFFGIRYTWQLGMLFAGNGFTVATGAAVIVLAVLLYMLLRRKVATAVLLKGNIYQSENVDSPFVLGLVRPKIYLPFRMNGQSLEHVIAHEEAHIRRKDFGLKHSYYAPKNY